PLRKIFLWSSAISFTGFAVFNIFQNFAGLITTVIIINIGTTILWPAIYTKVFHDHNENYSMIYVKLDRVYYLATALGPLLISLLMYLNLSPRYIFTLLLVLFFMLFILFYINYRDKIMDIPHAINNISGSEDSKKHLKQDINENIVSKNKGNKGIFKKITKFFTPSVIFANLSLAIFASVLTGTSSWLTTYFTSFDIAVSFSSILVSVYWIFGYAGLQIVSKTLSYVNEEKIIFYGGIISVISLTCFSFINIIFVKIIFLVMVAMSISSIYPLCGAITVRANPKSAGKASGFSIGMGIAGGLIVQPVMGFVAQYLSKRYVPYVLIVLAVVGTILSAILLKISFNKNRDRIQT
ncbi:MAG: MFS transporter, partial [Actinobacteria bacterium]|nr:MFS transporter [Actinomycetota bacterium]